MAKIGTAHVEIKPVLNEEALEALVQRIEDAIARGVERAINNARPTFEGVQHVVAHDPMVFMRAMQTEARHTGLDGIPRD